ncbi:menaquinone biosynthetic enzyme MqnA/MqnD family protein [Acanthopleuribacter pedis]|uniref:Chorismate dehydratase n=1 Tax=Acanthopleuribacter pedis TaxID=442870 RepID=A0A8J7U2E5_9BACT|nr:menaquinone biosynthesis protein [Acanthopleuribacter pedis]MBO1319233.1 menaquinone biosynthesis protein [Acanthopleuribacter pedis]
MLHDTSIPVRFSIIDYLNALPLNMAFKDGIFGDEVNLHFDFPSQCADNLASNRCDVGLISSIEYQRIPHLLVAPHICIASRREVRSVLILTKKPLAEVHTLALDRFSRSSAALVQVIFHLRFGRQPRFLTMSPRPEAMLAEADAALIIGDAALRPLPEDVAKIDLAAEWFQRTGLPFVFAFWTMRPNLPTDKISAMLLKAKNYGLPQIEQRMPEIRARWDFPAEEIQHYFRHNIHYDLGDEERESLQRFYRYAEEVGLIKHPRPLRWADEGR